MVWTASGRGLKVSDTFEMMSGAAPTLSQAQRTRLFHRTIVATSTGVVIVDLRLPDQPPS